MGKLVSPYPPPDFDVDFILDFMPNACWWRHGMIDLNEDKDKNKGKLSNWRMLCLYPIEDQNARLKTADLCNNCISDLYKFLQPLPKEG